MIAFERILCPIDLSPYSRGALGYALAIARWYDGRVTALHAAPASLPPLSGLAETVAAVLEPRSDPADVVRRFVGAASSVARVPVDVVVRAGEADAVILDYERETFPDLLVLGRHGLSAIEKRVVGSVSDKVLREAVSPVLVVHDAAMAGAFEVVPFRTVLAAVDFSHGSVRALEYAYAVAQEARARVVLLHVVEEERSEARTDEAERVARERLHDVLPVGAALWCEPDLVVAHGPVDEAIGRIAGEWKAELVVLGTEGRGAHAVGAHVEGVLGRVGCPVLAIPRHRSSPHLRPEPELAASRG
jgi:nucleotide-binding universal stress UspA family protein